MTYTQDSTPNVSSVIKKYESTDSNLFDASKAIHTLLRTMFPILIMSHCTSSSSIFIACHKNIVKGPKLQTNEMQPN